MKNLSAEWIVKQIYKYKFIFIMGFAIGMAGPLCLYKFLPRKYKTIGKINVSPKYFQNPMMMDFLPSVYDANELKAEREAAIIGALSSNFLNGVLLQENKNALNLSPLEHDNEIEKLKHNFEIFRETTTVFQIAAVSNTPEKSYNYCNNLINEIVLKAQMSRAKYLEQLRDAIKARLQSLKGNDITSTPLNEIKQQIEILEKQKKQMIINYNPNHPDVLAVTNKIATLTKMLTASPNERKVYTTNSIDPTQKANNGVKERLEEDLMKKYQNLEIVLDLENQENNMYVTVIVPPLRSKNHISPQLSIFMSFSLIIGFFLGIGAVAFKSRHEMLTEIEKDFFQIDPVTGKKRDRRNPNNPAKKDFTTMDQ